jgi:hypothetical protein
MMAYVDRQKETANYLAFGLVILLICLSGCALVFDPKKVAPDAVAVAAPAPPVLPISLSPEAESALKAAEQSVIEGKIKRTLWSAAVEQLAKAKSAAKIFNSETTLKYAKETIALCELSKQQVQSPAVTW